MTTRQAIISRSCGGLSGLVGFLGGAVAACEPHRVTCVGWRRLVARAFAVPTSSAIIAAISGAARGMMPAWPPSAEE
jgi:hypothetical protein